MKRLVYLDNLRSVAMLLGVFVHVGTLGDFSGYGQVFGVVSAYFRMSLFFLLSGFFGALMLDRRPVWVFLRQRMLNLGLPLVTCLLLLNPVTLVLVYRYHNMEMMPDFSIATVVDAVARRTPAKGPLIWHLHLWFLFSLIVYVLAAPILVRLTRRLAAAWVVRQAGDRAGASTVTLGLTGAIIMLVVVVAVLNRLVAEAVGTDHWLVRATLLHWPYYLAGMFLYAAPQLWEKAHRVDPFLIVGSALALWAVQSASLEGVAGAAVNLVVGTIVRCTIIFVLLALFRAMFNRRTRLSAALSDSIYTVYLLHYLTIYVLANLWISVGGMTGAGCWLIAFATIALTYGFHHFVVRRIPLVQLCLNGKRQAAREEHRA